jgi:ubiquitin carboxyl-terminal hydrolase 36/42
MYNNAKKQWCPLCCLVSLAKEVFENSSRPQAAADGMRNALHGFGSSRDPLSIRYFTHFVQYLNSSFTFGDQHDAQELYVALLDAIECVFLRENEAKTKGGADAMKKLDQFSKETTLMNHVFTCYTRTQVECTMCGNISKSYATETGIMLSVPEEGKFNKNPSSHTLINLLGNFTAVEILEGDDAYRCDACCARVKAHKSNVIEIAPNILAIQLSRVGMSFSTFFNAGEEVPQKNSAAVEFPLELDLTPFMALNALDASPAVYELYAVVTHEGSTTEDGHYISIVRYGGGGGGGSNSINTQDGQWYVCDDDLVSPLSVDTVLKQQEEAYLLLYERKQPRMPLLLHEVEGGCGCGDATDITHGAEFIEKFTAPQEVMQELKPRAATTTEEEEEEEEEEDSVGYVFEMEKNDAAGRALRLKVRLPTFDDDDSAGAEPQLNLKPGKPVVAEVSCGNCIVNMPLPVEVELSARKLEWNRDEKILHALFDVL